MNLNQELEKSKHLVLDSIDDNITKLNNIIVANNTEIEGNELKYEAIHLGLCISCANLGDCQWQENNKIHCEHYL